MPVSWCSFLNRKVLENFIAIICEADGAVLNAQILNLNQLFSKDRHNAFYNKHIVR